MKIKRKVGKNRKKRAAKTKGKQTPNQEEVLEFDNLVRERLRSAGIIE